jgi:hypothetical protein
MLQCERYLAPPAAGGVDAAPLINAAVNDIYANQRAATLYLDVGTYSVQSSILRRRNFFIKGAVQGSWVFNGPPTHGTIIKWAGPAGGSVFYETLGSGDTEPFSGGGVSNLSVDCSDTAAEGIMLVSGSSVSYKNLFVYGATAHSIYFGTRAAAPVMTQTYSNTLEDISIHCSGGTNGFVLDGAPGSGMNTCFTYTSKMHITFESGTAFDFTNADNNYFFGCAASMVPGKN